MIYHLSRYIYSEIDLDNRLTPCGGRSLEQRPRMKTELPMHIDLASFCLVLGLNNLFARLFTVTLLFVYQLQSSDNQIAFVQGRQLRLFWFQDQK